ncbi:MAG: urea carboxylase-associated family protein [Bdellovibrionaceae bacterium]|nr:urea carboxylase-associated family protein [Pseudobdellovibrionaceae bacterium]
MIRKERIDIQKGVCFPLLKGQVLKVIDPYGEQVSDLFCFNLHDNAESLSAGRSIDYNDTIYLTTGHKLYSNRSNVLLEILEDRCGRHDFLMTPCSLKMFQIVAQSEDYHPSCHENLALNFAAHKITPDQISTTFNIFMNVQVAAAGEIKIERPLSKSGDFILLKAHTDLLVGLTACSHEETNGGTLKPIDFEIHPAARF